jgi:hypothetical protein
MAKRSYSQLKRMVLDRVALDGRQVFRQDTYPYRSITLVPSVGAVLIEDCYGIRAVERADDLPALIARWQGRAKQ